MVATPQGILYSEKYLINGALIIKHVIRNTSMHKLSLPEFRLRLSVITHCRHNTELYVRHTWQTKLPLQQHIKSCCQETCPLQPHYKYLFKRENSELLLIVKSRATGALLIVTVSVIRAEHCLVLLPAPSALLCFRRKGSTNPLRGYCFEFLPEKQTKIVNNRLF